MTDGLDKNMSKISSSAGLVADQSSQLAATSRALSEGSTQQASALSETSSSMTEMASQTKTSAENASEAQAGRGGPQLGEEGRRADRNHGGCHEEDQPLQL